MFFDWTFFLEHRLLSVRVDVSSCLLLFYRTWPSPLRCWLGCSLASISLPYILQCSPNFFWKWGKKVNGGGGVNGNDFEEFWRRKEKKNLNQSEGEDKKAGRTPLDIDRVSKKRNQNRKVRKVSWIKTNFSTYIHSSFSEQFFSSKGRTKRQIPKVTTNL